MLVAASMALLPPPGGLAPLAVIALVAVAAWAGVEGAAAAAAAKGGADAEGGGCAAVPAPAAAAAAAGAGGGGAAADDGPILPTAEDALGPLAMPWCAGGTAAVMAAAAFVLLVLPQLAPLALALAGVAPECEP